jgi:hypothetical protein
MGQRACRTRSVPPRKDTAAFALQAWRRRLCLRYTPSIFSPGEAEKGILCRQEENKNRKKREKEKEGGKEEEKEKKKNEGRKERKKEKKRKKERKKERKKKK